MQSDKYALDIKPEKYFEEALKSMEQATQYESIKAVNILELIGEMVRCNKSSSLSDCFYKTK